MKDKLNFSAGVLNCVSGAAMAVNTVFMLLFVIVFIAMPILLPIWFLPMALVLPIVGLAFFVSLAAAVCDLVSGVGTILASIKGGTVSKVFAVISTVVDGVFIPVALFFLVIWSMGYTASALSIALLTVSVVAFGVTVAGLVVNIVCLTRLYKTPAQTLNK